MRFFVLLVQLIVFQLHACNFSNFMGILFGGFFDRTPFMHPCKPKKMKHIEEELKKKDLLIYCGQDDKKNTRISAHFSSLETITCVKNSAGCFCEFREEDIMREPEPVTYCECELHYRLMRLYEQQEKDRNK